jgi:hypothetical protein
MDRAALNELHYLTAIENLQSIAARGILSHDGAAALRPVDLSDSAMQDRRRAKEVAYAGVQRPRKLHTYANLFLHGRNSMLKALCARYGHVAVAVVRVSVDVLDAPGAVITDQNAASSYARFYESPAGLAYLSEELVFARGWGDPDRDQIDYWRRKSQRSAEVLVPDVVPPEFLLGVLTSCEATSEACATLQLPRKPTIDADLFFQ